MIYIFVYFFISYMMKTQVVMLFQTNQLINNCYVLFLRFYLHILFSSVFD